MRALYGICKIIFCRLMMLYTQYCPMGVFIYVSSLLFPYCCRCFRLQTPEKVLLVTTTIATVVFYWTTVLQAQFLPINLLFLVSVCCWVHLLKGGSAMFQVVSDSSNSLQVVAACFMWFQLGPGGSRLCYVVSARFVWFHLVLVCSWL